MPSTILRDLQVLSPFIIQRYNNFFYSQKNRYGITITVFNNKAITLLKRRSTTTRFRLVKRLRTSTLLLSTKINNIFEKPNYIQKKWQNYRFFI